MELNFKIQHDRLIAGSVLEGNTGNMNAYICKFNVVEDTPHQWFCVFKDDKTAYRQIIKNSRCVLPNELLEACGNIQIGCYGTKDGERISTNWLTFSVNEGAYCIANAPDEPTPDVWEELVMNSVPYIGESGNWYVYDKEKGEYIDSGVPSRGEKGETGQKGDKGDPGDLTVKYFPDQPQIDITIEEAVRYIDIEKMPDTGYPLVRHQFTCAKVMITNSPQNEAVSTEFQTKLNKSNIYLSAPTSFLYNDKKQYWVGYFDIPNNLAFGHETAVTDKSAKAKVLMPTNQDYYASLAVIISFRFNSVMADIPVGTNIKIWLK